MEMIIDYEVEGCWTTEKAQTQCRCCGAIEERVPKKGHYNSRYHYLKQEDGCDLYCCPAGCSVEKAEQKMKIFLEIYQFCTPGNHSYQYQIDYTKVRSSWISPEGDFYPVPIQGHRYFAENVIGMSERKLEERRWAKVSTSHAFNFEGFTSKQRDTLFDYMIANNFDTSQIMKPKFEIKFELTEDKS